MKVVLALLTLMFLSTATESPGQALSDSRFGTAGLNNSHWQWFRAYNQDYNDVSLPRDIKRLWTVGKLDDGLRNLGINDWCTDKVPLIPRISLPNCDRESEPPFAQLSRYEKILDWDAAGIKKIIRAYNNHFFGNNTEVGYAGAEKIHISIGNEPNWYPYVKPNAYARIFKKYYDYIKGPAPQGLNCQSCVIHNGGIMLANFEVQGVVLDIADGFVSILGEPLSLMKRFYKTGTAQDLEDLGYLGWTRMFLTELAVLKGQVDIFDAHAYKVDIGPNEAIGHIVENPSANLDKFITVIKGGKVAEKYYTEYNLASGTYTCRKDCGPNGKWGLANTMGKCLEDRNNRVITFPDDSPCAYGSRTIVIDGAPVANNMPYNYPNPVVWIDEFGDMQNHATQAQVTSTMNSLVSKFKATPAVAKWFWFKTAGSNSDLEMLRMGTFGAISLTSNPLYTGETLTALTALGQTYLGLQDASFINNVVPRVSTSPIAGNWLNLPKYPQIDANILLSFDFNNKTSTPYQGWDFGSSTSATVHNDGVSWSRKCGSTISRTFTTAEQEIIKDARYLVIERGSVADVPGDFFAIEVRNQDGSSSSKTISRAFGSGLVNALEEQGEVAVLDLAGLVSANQTLKSATYNMGVTLGLCNQTTPTLNYAVSRAYFTRVDPVPAVGYNAYPLSSCGFAGVTTIRPDIYAGSLSHIPVVIGHCSNGTLALDAASLGKGMTFDGNAIRWTPTSDMIGIHNGILTLTGSGKIISKPFIFEVKKRVRPAMPWLSLLLN